MNNSSRKSQAAMEFLLTYGWAILVVLVAIGALSYFGVLSPDRFLPSKCIVPGGIVCIDFKLDGSATQTVTAVLRNGAGFDVTGVLIAVTGCTGSPAGVPVANGAQATLTDTTCTLVSGSKFNGDVNVTYTNADTGISHKVQGSITGKAE